MAEAAEVLDVSVEAVGGRIKRGPWPPLTSERGEDGTVYVLPDATRYPTYHPKGTSVFRSTMECSMAEAAPTLWTGSSYCYYRSEARFLGTHQNVLTC